MTAPTTTPARDVLTQTEAEERARAVANVAYDLALSLTAGAPTYHGDVTARFDYTGSGRTFFCFRGKTIERLEVNGRQVEPEWNGYRLWLPADAVAARNTVRIVYENEYDHTGDGLHQFIDPEDGAEYLYTNFEPYEAHRLFPCFDQPDIKASYTLAVDAPAGWELVANSPEVSRETLPDGRLRRRFEPTKRFSTYLFALVAGPYHVFARDHTAGAAWTPPGAGPHPAAGQRIPLRFFCRKSMVRHLEHDLDEIFDVTAQGFDFFAWFFDYPYAFGKYDQVFVPEFNAGAMENVGAITHSEVFVFRDPPTDEQRLVRADVILHEMAHMWFGDLATMRWWNDLWLNESFATYTSYLALAGATRFQNAWLDFNTGNKNSAYRADQLVTTHPIAGQVGDTDETFLNFDGITYGKGASVLKQLVAYIGLDAFRDGVRRYFKRYGFGNATLRQFLEALEEGSGRDLQAWARAWLETPSLNTISTTVELDGERLVRLALHQAAPPDYPTLRPHRLEVALGREEGDRVTLEALDGEIDGEEAELPEAVGRRAPAFVFPNHNDHDFAKVALDPASLAYLRLNLERVDDRLLRTLIWQALWNMVRDQQLKSTDFLAIAREKAALEPDRALVETILGYAQAVLARWVPDAMRETEGHALLETAAARLPGVADEDLRIIWSRTLVNAAISPDDLVRLARIADGQEPLPGAAIDQAMRWELAARHVAFGVEGAAARAQAEAERDPSDRGQRARLRCETAVPDAGVKSAAWERFRGEGYGSMHLTRAAMGGFNWTVQEDLLEPYAEKFFQDVPQVYEEREKEFAQTFFGGLFPGYRVERDVLARSEALLREVGDRNPNLARSLREANDDLARAIACRELVLAGLD